MNKKIFTALLFIFAFTIGLFTFAGCTEEPKKINFYLQSELIKTIDLETLTEEEVESIVIPEAPRGYQFDRWQTSSGFILDKNNTEDFKNYILTTKETNIYLHWMPIEYSVDFNMNGHGQAPMVSTYNIDSNYYISNPYEEGYNFIGWTSEFNSEPTFDLVLGDGYNIGDITFTANWEIVEIEYLVEVYFESEYYDGYYDINYDLTQYLSGTINETVSYDAPSYYGYTLNDELSELTGTITSYNMLVLKVYYQCIRVNVTFVYDNGTPDTVFKVKQGETLYGPNYSPTKQGYTFSCWEEVDGPSYFSDQMRNIQHYKDTTFIAHYTPNSNTKYYIKIYAEKVDGSFELKRTDYDFGTTGVLQVLDQLEILNKTPYGDYIFNSLLSITSGTILPDESLTLELYYSLKTYQVEFLLNGGTLQDPTYELVYTVKSGATITPPVVTKKGYTLSYWTNLDNYNNYFIIKKDQTFTPVYQAVQVDVITYVYKQNLNREYDLYTTITNKFFTESTATVRIPSTLTANKDEYANYVFDTAKSITSECTLDNNFVRMTVKPENNVINLYYNLKELNIVFDLDIEGEEDIVYTYLYSEEIPNTIYPENPEKEHYSFVGWDKEIITPILETQTIKAIWKANEHTIEYILEDGVENSKDNKTQYTIEDSKTVLSYPTKKGYKFLGWTINESETKIKDLKYEELNLQDVTLTAHFELEVYTITYNGVEDAINNNPATYTIISETIRINYPVRIGYTFTGWKVTYGTSIMDEVIVSGSTGNKTFTATWQKYVLGDITLTFGDNIYENVYVKDIEQDNISVEFFGAKCVGNDGKEVPVTMEKLYLEEDWLNGARHYVKFTATCNGETKTKEINFLVVTKPTITFRTNKYNVTDLNNEYLYYYLYEDVLQVDIGATADAIKSYKFSKNGNDIDDMPQEAGIYLLTISVTDNADYNTTLSQEVKVYSSEGITCTFDASVDKVALGLDSEELIELFKVEAKDSVGGELHTVYVSSANYPNQSGTSTEYSIYLKDTLGNAKWVYTQSVKVYATPSLNENYSKYVFIGQDYKELFTAKDSFGEELEITLEISNEPTIYESTTFTATCTDILGQTNTKTITKLISPLEFGFELEKFNETFYPVLTGYVGTDIDIVIPEGTILIGGNIFGEHAENIRSIVVPNCVERIGAGAFLNCINIEELSIPFIGNYGGFKDAMLGYYGLDYTYQVRDILVNSEKPNVYFNKLKKLTITRDFIDLAKLHCTVENCRLNTEIGYIGENFEELIIDVADASHYDPTLFHSRYISGEAFGSYSHLKKLVLPDFVTDLPDLSGTTNLQTVYPTSITSGLFGWCPNLTTTFTYLEGVTEIPQEAFKGCSSITNINLPSTLTTINQSAFEDCTNLQSITLPNGLTTIHNKAFKNCSNLKDVVFPNSLKTINSEAFRGCLAFKKLVLPDVEMTIGARAFYECNLTEITLPYAFSNTANSIFSKIDVEKVILSNRMESISYNFIYNIKCVNSIGYMKIPASVTSILYNAFDDSDNGYAIYKKIEIDENSTMTEICDYAFYYSKVEELVLPSSIKTIGYKAFEGSKLLKAINLENVTTINDSAFSNCEALTTINLSNNLTTINAYAFYNCNLGKLTLPERCLIINYQAFAKNPITEIILNDKLQTLIGEAFAQTDIESIIIPNSVTQIGSGLFADCKNLKNITLPENEAEITLTETFKNCSSLESLVIPSNVTTISKLFDGCSSLKTIEFKGSVESFSMMYGKENAATNVEKVIVPSIEAWFNMGFLNGSYSLSEDRSLNTPLCYGADLYINNTLYEFNIDNLTEIPALAFDGMDIESLIIPETVTKIGRYAFANCKNLKYVEIKAQVTDLDGVFKGCTSLETVILPDTVINLTETFANCTSLKEITLPDSIVSMSQAFKNCTLLKIVNIPSSFTGTNSQSAFENCALLQDIILPEGVTTIGEAMFKDCINLEIINFPSTLTVIDDYAFQNCVKLNNISLNEGLTFIGKYVFNNCASLESLILPSSVSSLGDYLMKDCVNLEYFEFNNLVKNIPAYCFENCISLTTANIVYGTKLEKILEGAFKGCIGLTTLPVPSTVEFQNIYQYAFQNCTGLTHIEINFIYYNIFSIFANNKHIFDGCVNITSIEFGEGFTNISLDLNHLFRWVNSEKIYVITFPSTLKSNPSLYGYKFELIFNKNSIFYGKLDYYWLQKVDIYGELYIPEGITEIKYDTFTNQTNITKISLPTTLTKLARAFDNISAEIEFRENATITTIESTTFNNYLRKEIKLPSSITTIEGNGLKNFTKIMVDKVEYFAQISFESASCNPLSSGAKLYVNGEIVKNIKIGYDEELLGKDIIIGNYAFACYSEITQAEISASSIGEGAFKNCANLIKLYIVKADNFADSAFENCTALTKIYISFVNDMGSYAFAGCTSLEILMFNVNALYWTDATNVFDGCNKLKDLYFMEEVENQYNKCEENVANMGISFENIYIYSPEQPENKINNKYWHFDENYEYPILWEFETV